MENTKFNKLLQYVKERKTPTVTGESLTLNQYKKLCQYANLDYQHILISRIYKVPIESRARL